MEHSARIKIAALATTAFIGGLAALGISIGDRNTAVTAKAVNPQVRTQVIHETKIKTVHVKAKPRPITSNSPPVQQAPPVVQPARPAVQPQPVVQRQPVVVVTPKKVTSRVSPVSGGGEGEEHGEGGEHEGGGDD